MSNGGKIIKKKDKNVHSTVISLLSSAGLSIALISWITTAVGLERFVFSQMWQAFVISGAIQGALFTCNIKGPDIMRTLNRNGKMIFSVFYAVLLLASSIFSFVYIEQIAYPENVLRDDAERLLITECLEMNYTFDSAIERALDVEKVSIDSYVMELSVSDSETTAMSDNNLPKLISQLETYAEDMGIAELISIISLLKRISNGRYSSDDMMQAKEYLKQIKETSNSRIVGNDKMIDINRGTINGYSSRLETFNDTSSQYYIQLNDGVTEMEDLNNSMQIENANLTKQILIVDALLLELENIDNSLESSLQKNVRSIRTKINQEQLDTKQILMEAEAVYENLIENNVSSEDKRLIQYSSFKLNVENYAKLREIKSNVNEEIDKLNLRYSQISDEEVYEETEVEESTLQENKEKQDINWRQYWHERIGNIRINVKDIPEDYLKSYSNGNDISAKLSIIQKMTDMERLYVSDLNQFEKAWTLLLDAHPYKKMVIFSFAFALFMDLFSAIMGKLIYQYKLSIK